MKSAIFHVKSVTKGHLSGMVTPMFLQVQHAIQCANNIARKQYALLSMNECNCRNVACSLSSSGITQSARRPTPDQRTSGSVCS